MKPKQFLSHLVQLVLEQKMFQTKVIENVETNILCSVTFFRKSCRFLDNVEKQCKAGHSTDDNMAHVHCMLDS
jgi:hypothetical protein